MPVPYTGRGLAIGIGEESTWGTAVSRTVWFPGVSESMKRTVTKRPRPTLAEATASSNRRSHFIESDFAGGTFEILATFEGLGLLLKHILGGTPATTGPSGGIYTHTFKMTASPPTGGLTIEVVRGNGTAEVFEGCRISKAVFKIEAGGLLRITCTVIAETSGGRTSAGTPSYTSSRDLIVAHYFAGTVAWNATNYAAKGVEFTIDNKYATNQLLGSNLTKEPPKSDFADVLGKLDLTWDQDTLNTGLSADTESDLSITFTGPSSRALTLELHNAYLEDVSDPVNGPGVVMQSGSFRGQSDGTDEGFEVVIANTQSSAVAA